MSTDERPANGNTTDGNTTKSTNRKSADGKTGRPVDEQPADENAGAPTPVLISAPREPVGAPLRTAAQVREAAQRLAAGTGPVAVDAERASGYRYSQRAYLVQLWRAGTGTLLVDPIPTGDLTPINEALADVEWVLHAASQDLACLREVNLSPTHLFDTELAGRLLGLERVSLSSMLERFAGLTLEKGFSAADWSTRPLPPEWLVYAALDVELLIRLRDEVAAELEHTGKTEWARQEFAAELAAPPSAPRTDPWRRLSGIHVLRNRRQLALARGLWIARDEYAAERDIAPGRVLPDAAIVAAARTNPTTVAELAALPVFKGPRQRRNSDRWFAPLAAARELPETELPPLTARVDPDAIPAPSRWRDRDPDAAARLAAVRQVVAQLSEQREVQAQNLLAGDTVRRLSWAPPEPLTEPALRRTMSELGARPWQIDLTRQPLLEALGTTATTDPPNSASPAG